MVSASVATPEDFIAAFPRHPGKIEGLPTYEAIKALRADLAENASSIACTLGGGARQHGFVIKLDEKKDLHPKTPDGLFLITTQPPELWILEAKLSLTVRHGRCLS